MDVSCSVLGWTEAINDGLNKAKLSHSRRWPSWRPQDEKHDDGYSGRQKQSFLHEWPNGVLLEKRGCRPRDLAGFVQRHRTTIFS
jgi:hypothetical protein